MYEEARARLATVLATVSITTPITASIQRVYTEAPMTITDDPCFVLYGSDGEMMWMAGGTAAEDIHTETFRLFVSDADWDQAHAIANAFWKATRAALKPEGGLGNFATVARLIWRRPAGYQHEGEWWVAQEYAITFHPKET